ncbi:FAD-dependent monooxygenase [Streptomyces sp. NBC_01216]|uniref:FAD-dependent monooxygenase n=1 Tax=unclassified Streptomyces TaxID=2593676 RepID=UPI002E14A704|nr:FAD-dependent monooxygenase [Streptomyces sp. NBC_01216]
MDDDRGTVLISGAGIAGPVLAYWLARGGWRPTVVEHARGPRSSGSPVDVAGEALDVVRRMGVLPRLREAATAVTRLRLVDAGGRPIATLPTRSDLGGADGAVEVPRADLATVLYEAARDEAEFVFDDSVAALGPDARGVDVTFRKGPPRRFDLVVGADGQHSAVRRLAFGPERNFVHHFGMYVATLPLDGPAGDPRTVVMHNTPGRAAAVHPVRGRSLAFFAYRGPEVTGFDHRDTAQHRRLLTAAYADAGWRVPELLDRVREAGEDLYFDAVSRVRVPAWSRGRVALVGDAASSVSLFGEGSSLATTGAHTLAAELSATPEDPAAAFHRYEARHRTRVAPRQRAVGRVASLLVPATRPGLAARDLTARLWTLGSRPFGGRG